MVTVLCWCHGARVLLTSEARIVRNCFFCPRLCYVQVRAHNPGNPTARACGGREYCPGLPWQCPAKGARHLEGASSTV